MNKTFVLLATFSLAASVQAASTNLYDRAMQDCLDYGHQNPSAEKVEMCRTTAKELVLSSSERYSNYLDCVDYGHQQVTLEKDEACLREISPL